MVEPPNLEGQDPLAAFGGGEGFGGVGVTKKFKLVINQQSISPVEPITNLLNKRKEPEVPQDDEEVEEGAATGEGGEQEENHCKYSLFLSKL